MLNRFNYLCKIIDYITDNVMFNILKRTFYTLVVFVLAVGQSYALNVPSVISDNMVLQRNSAARVWGTAKPGEKISVTASWYSEQDFCYCILVF